MRFTSRSIFCARASPLEFAEVDHNKTQIPYTHTGIYARLDTPRGFFGSFVRNEEKEIEAWGKGESTHNYRFIKLLNNVHS